MKAILMKGISKIEALVNAYYFPFIVYGVLMFVIHLGIELDFGDDTIVFKPVLENGGSVFRTWIEFLDARYRTWSSRLVIESVLILVVHSTMLWRILDTAIDLLFALCLCIPLNP